MLQLPLINKDFSVKTGLRMVLPRRFHHRVALCVSAWVGVWLSLLLTWVPAGGASPDNASAGGLALLAAIAAMGSTFLLVAWRLRALEPLRGALQQAAQGDLECRVPADVAGSTPFGRHFNQCMTQLSEARTQLEAEIGERRRTEAALRENKLLFDAFMRYLPALAFMKDEVLNHPGSLAKAGWDAMLATPYASPSYVHTPQAVVSVVPSGTNASENAFRSDTQAVRCHALQWVVTGNPAHRDMALAIASDMGRTFEKMVSTGSSAQTQLESAWALPVWATSSETVFSPSRRA